MKAKDGIGELGQNEGNGDPPPLRTGNGVERLGHVQQDADEGVAADEGADDQDQVHPADAAHGGELGNLDTGGLGPALAQVGQECFLPVQSARGDRVQRGALEPGQGAGQDVRGQDPGGRGHRPLGPDLQRQRRQRRRHVAVRALGGVPRRSSRESP